MISSGMVTIPSHGRGWFIVVYPHYNHHEESQAQGRLRNWQLRLLAKQMTAAVCHVPPSFRTTWVVLGWNWEERGLKHTVMYPLVMTNITMENGHL